MGDAGDAGDAGTRSLFEKSSAKTSPNAYINYWGVFDVLSVDSGYTD